MDTTTLTSTPPPAAPLAHQHQHHLELNCKRQSSSEPIKIPLAERFSTQLSTGSADSGCITKTSLLSLHLPTTSGSLSLHGASAKSQLQKLKQQPPYKLLSQDSGIDDVGRRRHHTTTESSESDSASSQLQLKCNRSSTQSSSSESLGAGSTNNSGSSGISTGKLANNGGGGGGSGSGEEVDLLDYRRFRYQRAVSTAAQVAVEDRIEEVEIGDENDDALDDIDEDDGQPRVLVKFDVNEELDDDDDDDDNNINNDDDDGANDDPSDDLLESTEIGDIDDNLDETPPPNSKYLLLPPPKSFPKTNTAVNLAKSDSAVYEAKKFIGGSGKKKTTAITIAGSTAKDKKSSSSSAAAAAAASSTQQPQLQQQHSRQQVLATDGNYYFPVLQISDETHIDSKLINKRDGLQDTMYYLDEFGSPKLREKYARKLKQKELKKQKAKLKEEKKKRNTALEDLTKLATEQVKDEGAKCEAAINCDKNRVLSDNSTKINQEKQQHNIVATTIKVEQQQKQQAEEADEMDGKCGAIISANATPTCVSWSKVVQKFRSILGKHELIDN